MYKLIICRYLGPTNNLGSRIKLIDVETGNRVTLDKDYSYSSDEQVKRFLYDSGLDFIQFVSTDKGTAALVRVNSYLDTFIS